MKIRQLSLLENQIDVLNLTHFGLMNSRQIREALDPKSIRRLERKTSRLLEGRDDVPRDVRYLLTRESYINKYYLMMMYDGSTNANAYVDMLSEQTFMQNVGTAVGKTFSDYAGAASKVGDAVGTTLAHPVDSWKRTADAIWDRYGNFDTLIQAFVTVGSMIPAVKTAAGLTGVGYYLKEVYDNITSGEYLQATLSCILAVMSASVIEPTPITSGMGPFIKAWATFKNLLSSLGKGAIKTVADLSASALLKICQRSNVLAGVVGWISRFSITVLLKIEQSATVIFGDLLQMITRFGPKLGLESGLQTQIVGFLQSKLSSLATWAGELAETLFFAGNDETFKMVTSTAVQSTLESKTSGVTKGKAVATQGLSTALAAAPAATPPIVTGYAANTTKAPGPIKKA